MQVRPPCKLPCAVLTLAQHLEDAEQAQPFLLASVSSLAGLKHPGREAACVLSGGYHARAGEDPHFLPN